MINLFYKNCLYIYDKIEKSDQPVDKLKPIFTNLCLYFSDQPDIFTPESTTVRSTQPDIVSNSVYDEDDGISDELVGELDIENDDVESLQMLAKHEHSDLDENKDTEKTNTELEYRTQIVTPPEKRTLDPNQMQGDGAYSYNNDYLYKYNKKPSSREGKKKNRRKHRKHIKNKYNKLKQKDGVVSERKQQSEPSVSNTVLLPNSRIKSKYHSCADLKCQARGVCVTDKLRDGVRCQCQLGTEGEFCEKGM